MNVELREFRIEDLGTLEKWKKHGDIERFMSRYSPRSFTGTSWNSDITVWLVISVADRDVGTVWLEKNAVTDTVADLGIFLGVAEQRGQGIGREAIRQIAEKISPRWGLSSIRLRVRHDNERAIRCYEAAGFSVSTIMEKKSATGDVICAIEMTKKFKAPVT